MRNRGLWRNCLQTEECKHDFWDAQDFPIITTDKLWEAWRFLRTQEGSRRTQSVHSMKLWNTQGKYAYSWSLPTGVSSRNGAELCCVRMKWTFSVCPTMVSQHQQCWVNKPFLGLNNYSQKAILEPHKSVTFLPSLLFPSIIKPGFKNE